MMNLADLPTEQQNPRTMDLDSMTPLQIAQAMNYEDQQAIRAVGEVLPQVAHAIELATTCLAQGGRIIYMGAGTSGRIGLVDAAECPPTFGVSPNTVVGLIAGGDNAFYQAIEGAEDSTTQGKEDLKRIGLCSNDMVVGLAASGRTLYVVHGLRYANFLGCATVAIACTKNSLIGKEAQVAIEPDTGPEVLTGSTRLKAGTAQKTILNMISTGSMVGIGKAYRNLMVDMRQSNQKLKARAIRMVMDATDCTRTCAEQALREANGNAKAAIVMVLLNVSYDQAAQALDQAHGHARAAIAMAASEPR